MVDYFEENKDSILAINKEKAEKMLQSLGLQLPPEETPVNFDNGIAYTTANVKYPEQEKSKNLLNDPTKMVCRSIVCTWEALLWHSQ